MDRSTYIEIMEVLDRLQKTVDKALLELDELESEIVKDET